jgi:hypothetical protein
MQGTSIVTAFVSTNSITQGEQVGILWPKLLDMGIKITFAHRTFKWSNEASGKAAVHCVIIGFSNIDIPQKLIFVYSDVSGELQSIKVSTINPYLIEGPDIVLTSRRSPISDVPVMQFGNMANDGGFLIIEDEDLQNFLASEPNSRKYIRKLVGSVEFINDLPRWCLWLVGIEPNELRNLPEVTSRVQKVKDHRLLSSRNATRDLASEPALFGEIRQPDTDYLLIPRVSSENRSIVPIGYLSKDIIVTDRCAFVPDASHYLFGVLTSSMHMAWMRTVCGRLKSDYNYSINIVYNNFPWPKNPGANFMDKVEQCAQAVLDARKKHTGSTLADLYDVNTMPKDLHDAHIALDRAVDACYGKKIFKNETERLTMLFELYQNMSLVDRNKC